MDKYIIYNDVIEQTFDNFEKMKKTLVLWYASEFGHELPPHIVEAINATRSIQELYKYTKETFPNTKTQFDYYLDDTNNRHGYF